MRGAGSAKSQKPGTPFFLYCFFLSFTENSSFILYCNTLFYSLLLLYDIHFCMIMVQFIMHFLSLYFISQLQRVYFIENILVYHKMQPSRDNLMHFRSVYHCPIQDTECFHNPQELSIVPLPWSLPNFSKILVNIISVP